MQKSNEILLKMLLILTIGLKKEHLERKNMLQNELLQNPNTELLLIML